MLSAMNKTLALTGSDAAELALNREHLPKEVYLTIKGTLSSISNIFKVKNDAMFIIEIDSCTYLLIKNVHLEWHGNFEIGQQYVFHSVRITTLKKGILRPQTIYWACFDSSYSLTGPGHQIPVVPLQVWMEINQIPKSCFHGNRKPIELSDRMDEEPSLIHYQGIITSCDKAGLYILDNNVRLYFGGFLSIEKQQMLKQHLRISVFNVHCIKEDSDQTLVFCVKSSYKLEDNADSAPVLYITREEQELNVSENFKKFQLNWGEMETVTAIIKKLSRLGWQQNGRSAETIKMLQRFLLSHVQLPSLLDCFINHNLFCPFTNLKQNRLPVPLDLFTFRKEEVINLHLPLSSCNADKSSRRWSFKSGHSKTIVGQLVISASGQVELRDETDVFPVLVLASADDRQHLCCRECLLQPKPGCKLTCSVLDTWIIGQFVLVQEFDVVLENWSSERYTSKRLDKQFVYLMFSLKDCFFLGKPHQASAVLQLPFPLSLPGHKTSANESQILFYFYVFEKHPLLFSSVEHDQGQFKITGYKLSIDEGIKHFGWGDESRLVEASQTPREINLKERQPMMITFTEVSLYGVITPGHVYKLMLKDKAGFVNDLSSGLVDGKLQKAIATCKTLLNIQAPKGLIVSRLAQPVIKFTGLTQSAVYSVHDVLAQSFTEMIVSFRGIIIEREVGPSFFGMSASENCISLKVIDVSCNTDRIMVYCDVPMVASQLGLIKGSEIVFGQLERKVSKNGFVYCRLNVTSSVKIVALHPDTNRLCNTLSCDTTTCLFDIWYQTEADTCKQWSISAYVRTFFKLSLQNGMAATRGQGCTCGISCGIEAHAVVLVDDGSSQARVRFWGCNLVRQLLTLTARQWEDLVSVIKTDGDIVLIKVQTADLSSPTALFLNSLIESPLVLRPCRLLVQKCQRSSSAVLVSRLDYHSFPVKEENISGRQYQTLTLPVMDLKCVAVEEAA
ncbi:uncharacterized protein LOC131943780 [Physella acuta]|uniref:uncharacterized protein LOC131943780 n=1 Tax=Physella acuta TaxID=109671 RepID=UPI0027DB5A0D|nr:uncharacterized protein LOC131943780 [Physella acuta]